MIFKVCAHCLEDIDEIIDKVSYCPYCETENPEILELSEAEHETLVE